MGLYGSEYWTYLLPKHVGTAKAQVIMNECQPMLAEDAVNNGMADVMLSEDWKDYHSELNDYCSRLIDAVDFEQFLSLKVKQFRADNASKPFADYRREELTHMKETFYNLGSEYHDKRRDFVYKIKKAKQAATIEGRRVRARF
jgi:putative two-component system hydrogenase maturation factor HypX/HoxX